MKVHYINILLFSLPINILENNQRNHNSTIYHTSNIKPTKTRRTLCECDLYTSIYDNDPEMKSMMENFYRKTSQRFKEYDERIMKNRQKCREQCDKDIQKIILQDKIEKELTEKMSVLQTDMTTYDVPTCVCKKSITDKVEKTCLKCGGILGTSVPELGLIGGSAIYVAAINAATDAGIKAVTDVVIKEFSLHTLSTSELAKIVTVQNYANKTLLGETIRALSNKMCGPEGTNIETSFCAFQTNGDTILTRAIKVHTQSAVTQGSQAANEKFLELTTSSAILSDPIVISLIVVVAIAVILLIIYLILRYRKKNKMKKKLQYMKLLKE
ncbi:PIR protein, putative [Plasmodium sp.]|nr:PIR protein, putative [Plasmodium sp.]